MTLHDIRKIFNHWQRVPPLRLLVAGCAAALGVKLPGMKEETQKPMTLEEFQRMVKQTGGKLDGIGGSA